MNNYQPNYALPGFNMYGINPMYQPQVQRVQQVEQPYNQYSPQPIYKQSVGLQGKSVDSIDVVKAMEIPLDGSISYFPLTNGTAIITKQLQNDGTSKTVIYEPIKEQDKKEKTQYIIPEELSKQVDIINQNNNSLRDGLDNIRERVEELSDNFKELLNEMRNFKGGRK